MGIKTNEIRKKKYGIWNMEYGIWALRQVPNEKR